jgi:hypothetical protein
MAEWRAELREPARRGGGSLRLRLFQAPAPAPAGSFDSPKAYMIVDDGDEDEPMNSPIFQYLSANNSFGQFTHLTADRIEAIWRPVNAIMAAELHRGPIPYSTSMDHVLLYLIWLRTGQDYATIAKIFKMSESRLEDDLNRVRGPLLRSLEEKWWNPRRRPRRSCINHSKSGVDCGWSHYRNSNSKDELS